MTINELEKEIQELEKELLEQQNYKVRLSGLAITCMVVLIVQIGLFIISEII